MTGVNLKKALAAAGAVWLILLVATLAGGLGREATNQILAGSLGREPTDQGIAPAGTSFGDSVVILQNGLATAAQEISQRAPIRVDADTTLTGARAWGDQLTYEYSVDKEISPAEQQQFANAKTVEICNDRKMRSLVQAGAALRFVYTMPSQEAFDIPVSNCA